MSAATMKDAFERAEVVSLWTAPDMTVPNAGRRSPVPMPAELLGPAYPLMQAVAEGTATPIDYPAIGYLAACASLIGGKRRVRPYKTSAWSEPCILWCGVVGDPSSRKSPALDVITAPLREIERDHAEQHKQALREWQQTMERAKVARATWQQDVKDAAKDLRSTPRLPDEAVEPDEPHRRRTMIMDATPEAVGWVLAGNPVGTLHFRDELAGWLSSFDRYSPGGREFWLEAYGGRPFVIDRKGTKEPLTIEFNGVSVLGGIQPGKLADALLSSTDDGLVARFLWAWPDKAPFRRPRVAADLEALEMAYRRLESLCWATDSEGKNTALTLPLSSSAADVFERWQSDNGAIDDDTGNLFKSFVGKMDGAVLRLALVGELSAWAFNGGAEPSEISVDALVAAAAWVDDYAKPMAERVYGDAALPAVERNAAVLARYIRKTGLRQINKRELRRSPHKSHLPCLRDVASLDAVLAHLADAGWLREAMAREGPTPGRQREDYLVNPAVFGG